VYRVGVFCVVCCLVGGEVIGIVFGCCLCDGGIVLDVGIVGSVSLDGVVDGGECEAERQAPARRRAGMGDRGRVAQTRTSTGRGGVGPKR
jgi:hypothetical protein